MKIVILQSNYIPWKGYFDLINDADIFVFYDEVKYTKNDWRNRNKIYTSFGEQWLSIPIHKDAVKQKISEVEITDKFWQEKHYKALSLGYRRAPHFQQLLSLMDDIYKDHQWNNLSELNKYIIKKVSGLLEIPCRFIDSAELNLEGDRVERLLNILSQLNASEYISGPAAKDYMKDSEHLFAERNIKLTYKDYTGYPEYPQLYAPFNHYVSILDLIANLDLETIKEKIWKWRGATIKN